MILLSSVMRFLEGTFGYDTAIKIKDSFDFIDGIIFGTLILLWLVGKFFLEVWRDDRLPKDIAIMWVEKADVLKIAVNPKSVFEAVEVFIGYLILKIFRQKSIQLKKLPLRIITVIILIITLLIFLIGIEASMYSYFPHDGHSFP